MVDALGPKWPKRPLDIEEYKLKAGIRLHRIHPMRYGVLQFNPGQGNSRFSPIMCLEEKPIPTMYAASSEAAALMETVFHSTVLRPGPQYFKLEELRLYQHSTIELIQELELADLASTPLRRLGLERGDLIDTSPLEYERTRAWAVAIHQQHSSIQGLTWVSRQDDTARAYLFFGDRIQKAFQARQTHPLLETVRSKSSKTEEVPRQGVLDLARRIGVKFT